MGFVKKKSGAKIELHDTIKHIQLSVTQKYVSN